MKMNYRQQTGRNISRHITSSLSLHGKGRDTGRNGFKIIFILLLIAIAIFFIFRKPIDRLMLGTKSLFVPKVPSYISLEPSAMDAMVIALEMENEELRKLTGRTIRYPIVSEDNNIASDTGDTDSANNASGTDKDVITIKDNEIVASVIMRPPQLPYDVLVINSGSADGLQIADQVYAFSGYPIGEIIYVDTNSAKVRLLSAPDGNIEVLVGTSTVSVLAEGKGGGNFFLKLPKVTDIQVGDIVARKYLPPEVFSSIESVDAEAGEAYTYAYFKLPINLNSLVYVIVKKNSGR